MKRLIAALARIMALPFLLAAMVVPALAQEGGYLIRAGRRPADRNHTGSRSQPFGPGFP
jgi:hypothetical protein